MDIYFHQDSILWNGSNNQTTIMNLNKKYGVNLESEINVWFIENPNYDNPGGRAYAPQKFASKYKQGVYEENFYANDTNHNFGQNLSHELGHCLGLDHPYEGNDGAGCNGTNLGNDNLEDTWCPDASGGGYQGWCDPTVAHDDNCTNNIMALSRLKEYHSPLQIAVMHHQLTATNASRFLTKSSYPSTGDILVTGHEVWNNPKIIDGNITIENGASLTLNCVVRLTENKKIKVKNGGELFIEGGSVLPAGPERWHGIEVLGNPDAAQYPYSNQGYFKMTDGIIANSWMGVYTHKEENGEYVSGYEGGVVQIDGNINSTRFYNNTYQVTIRGNNLLEALSESYIKGAYFSYSERYNYDTLHTKNHISLFDDDLIELESLFINGFGSTNPTPNKIGTGLYVQNTNVNFIMNNSSRFQVLEYGIRVENTDPTKTINIEASGTYSFINNLCGVYLSGVSNASITGTHHMLTSSAYIPHQEYCGIYLDNSTGYHVEDNEFDDYSGGSLISTGIVVNSSGDELNVLYRNYFTNMEIGIGAEGDNRGTTISDGLKIKCNDFTNCEADIKVVPDIAGAGISRYQGNSNSEQGPAGNLFSKNNNSNPFSDFNNTNSYAPIVYVHHSGDPDNDDWVPKYYSSSTMGLKDAFYPYPGFSIACPSYLDTRTKSELNSIVSANQTLMNESQSELEEIEDGGNTPQLVTEVETSQPGEGYELQTQLLDESSNLSDDVMESSIQKEDVLNEAQLTEVLSANPQAAKSERIKLALDNRNNPLPEYMLEQINQGVAGMSLKEMIEADRSFYLQEMRQAQYSLLQKYKLDEENYSIEDFIEELENMNMPHATYSMAFQQLRAGNISEAESIINTIPQEYSEYQELLYDHEDYTAYFELLSQMKMNNLRVEELSAEQLTLLEELAYEIDNYSNVYARNMLNRYYGERPTLEYNIFGNNNKMSTVSQDNRKEEAASTLKVYPNPAKYHLTVEIEGNYSDLTKVTIMDKLGRIQKRISFSGNVKSIATHDLPNGTYIVQVTQGEKLFKAKITIE